MGRLDRGQEEPAPGSPCYAEVGAGREVRTLTSEAESVVPGQRVREACLVGVEVDGSHAWLVPATGRPRGDYGVAEAAIGQPASIALVQATAPGGIELARGGQCSVVGFTELQGFLEGELLRACDEEHLPWEHSQVAGVFTSWPGLPLSPSSANPVPIHGVGHLPWHTYVNDPAQHKHTPL